MTNIKLTEQECQTLLENRFKNPKLKFIKYELLPISEVSQGYLGEHYNLRITYLEYEKALTIDFFLKHTPTKNTFQIELSKKTNIYAREIFLYDFLFKEFEKYGFDVSFAARSYFCIPNKLIIMENMKIKGYITLGKNTNFNLEQMKCALKAIALYHAGGLAYQKTKSIQLNRNYKFTDDYNEFVEESFFTQHLHGAKNTGSVDFWEGCKRTMDAFIDLLPEDEINKKKFKHYLATFKFGKVFVDETRFIKTLGHGDLWLNNILFQMDDGIPVGCCLVDYQILRYFYPSFDVMLVIYFNSDVEFRNKHFIQLCNFYYTTLTEIYRNYGFELNDIMSKDDFEKTFKMLKADMLMQVASVSAITCIPNEILNDTSNLNDNSQGAFFDNHKIAVKAFQKSAVFRNILTEFLTELYATLEAQDY